MQKYKEKHDFMHCFLHKSRVLVGRGGFESLPPCTALYFKGIYDCAPTMPQQFLLLFYTCFQPFSS
jgi:hypothetical protein